MQIVYSFLKGRYLDLPLGGTQSRVFQTIIINWRELYFYTNHVLVWNSSYKWLIIYRFVLFSLFYVCCLSLFLVSNPDVLLHEAFMTKLPQLIEDPDDVPCPLSSTFFFSFYQINSIKDENMHCAENYRNFIRLYLKSFLQGEVGTKNAGDVSVLKQSFK